MPKIDPLTQAWIKSRADEIAVANGCRFDADAGQHVVDFFGQFLRLNKGKWAGQPFELQDWQVTDLLMPLFGWKRPDGTRRFRVGYVEIPKKNGKSATLSGLALYLLVGDGEPGAEVYGAASDKDQGGIIYREAASMVKASPVLASRVEVVDSRKTLAYPRTNSFYRVLSADAFRTEGLNVHGLLFDELHAQRDRRLWDALRYGGASRTQPMLLAITTAGYDRNSICWEQHEYTINTLNGHTRDDSFFGYIRAAEPDDDWTSEKVWRKANPSLGVTINLDDFKADCKEAQASPTKENAFKRYRLNIWTQQDVRWLTMAAWDACGEPFDPAILTGRRCFIGLDLSTKHDITAAAKVFPPTEDDHRWYLLPRFYVPKERAPERERKDRVPYLTWAKQGHITLTDGNVVDYERVKADITTDARLYQVEEIAYDPWNATQIALQLQEAGATCVEFGQGFRSMSEPTKELEKLMLSKHLAHGGHPVLRWMAGNVAVEQDPAGNIKPSKKKSPERIDGIVGSIMAMGRAIVTPEEQPKTSIYETQGLTTL